jgi:hypothetical protein
MANPHDNVYTVVTPTELQRDLTLYEACIAVAGAHQGDVIGPHARLVAFYCAHRSCVALGFAAYSWERDQIDLDFGLPVPL